jgi:hypothetical protein
VGVASLEVATVGAVLSDPQRRPVVEDLRVEAGRALVAARHLFEFDMADHGVEVHKPVRCTLLDEF